VTTRRGRAAHGPFGPLIGALLCALVVLAVVGCTPAESVPPSVAVESLGPGGIGPPVTLAPGATPLVRIDASLLAILPTDVDGLSVLESTEAEADAQANGSLASLSDGVAGALAIDPGTADFVLVDVVRLRAGVFDDSKFRTWRDTFDAGVCLDSGVIGHAQSTIGGRMVYVGTCGNGFHTYHTWIQDKNLLVSASSGGSRNLGEVLFANLKP
jgi:hypothetical protein